MADICTLVLYCGEGAGEGLGTGRECGLWGLGLGLCMCGGTGFADGGA